MGSFQAFLTVTILLLVSVAVPSGAQLSPTFYDATCPNAAATIRTSIRRAVSRERRMAASLIRLHFHDCFVLGCDASILLDDHPEFQSEKTAIPNVNSARGYEVIEAAKLEVERLCPGVVSCADVVTLAARDASVAVGGPSWTVRLGRRDSTRASWSQANSDLPPPFFDVGQLISSFRNKDLSVRDMVALSGAHTLGQAQCSSFNDHIYTNRTFIDPGFASTRRRQCPPSGGTTLAPLDLVTPNSFDNNYFRNLQRGRGLLNSDQVLFNSGSNETTDIVLEYSRNPRIFASDFASAMIRMSEITPLLGENGVIRRVCSALN